MRWIRYSALLLSVLVAACGGKGQSAGPPSDLTVQSNGDTQVTLNWTPQSGVQYWVLCAPGDTIDSKSWASTVGAMPTVHRVMVLASTTATPRWQGSW